MTITIAGKEYVMYFGLDFIDYLDKIYYIEEMGFKVGSGVPTVVAGIQMNNPVVLLQLIKAATITEKSQPSTADIKEYLETEADYEALFNDFLSSLETSYATAPMMKKFAKPPIPEEMTAE